MNNIELINEKYYSCFQVAIATYLKNNGYADYWNVFPNCWLFDYDHTKDSLLGERIESLWMSDLEDLNEYSGIKLKMVTRLGNEVYLVEMDAYDCCWGTVYQKYHMPHYFLIHKSCVSNRYIIVDSFFKKLLEADIETDKLKKIYEISMCSGRSLPLAQIVKMARNNMFLNHSTLTKYKKMRELAVDILESDYAHEIKSRNDDLYMNPLYNSFFRLEAGRHNFLKIISGDLKKKDTKLYSDLERVVSSWNLIRLNTIRLLLTNNTRLLKSISDALNELSYSEESTLNQLCVLYNITS